MASKVFFAKNGELTPLEQQVSSFLTEFSTKRDYALLSTLNLCSFKAVEVAGGKKAYVAFVPFRQHKKFRAIQERLRDDLEKKLSGPVIFIAQRAILSEAVSQFFL